MDSDDERYDDAELPDIPAAHGDVFGHVDMSGLISQAAANGGNLECFMDGPPISAEEEKAHKPPGTSRFGARMFDKMKHDYLPKEQRDILEVMHGDFSDIEGLMEPLTEDGCVKKVMIRPGTGPMLVTGDLTRIHYITCCEFMDEPFDSTYDKGFRLPHRYRVGTNEAITLMQIGIPTMRVGEIAKFLGTPDVCYGKLGSPQQNIPPNSRCLMQVEVIDVRADREELEVLSMTSGERKKLPFKTLLRVAVDLKDKANEKYANGEHDAAAVLNKELYDCILDMTPTSVEERDEVRMLSVKLHCNSALNYIKLERYKMAFHHAEKGTHVQGLPKVHMGKPFYLCAKAQFLLQDVEEAQKYIKMAASYGYNNNVIELAKDIEKEVKKNAAVEKQRCQRMFGVAVTPSPEEEAVTKKMNAMNLQK